MLWRLSYRADPRAITLADRHYSRQKPGTAQFVAPGRSLVLLTEQTNALWVSLWQQPQYIKHPWPRAWLCALFRNESKVLSSRLIQMAVAATRWHWGTPPVAGMVTFIDAKLIKSKRHPGQCFLKAGWKPAGYTKSGLLTLQLLPANMPFPQPPAMAQLKLFGLPPHHVHYP